MYPTQPSVNAIKTRRSVALLALLAVLWTQFALAAHQSEHALTDLGDACEVCLQLDRSDDAVPGEGALPVCPGPVRAAAALADEPARTVAGFAPRPRGPPLS